MPSVLFTSATMKNLAGTEIATLEQASSFLQRGWRASVFTLEAAPPLKDIFPPEITIYDVGSIPSAPRNFDLIIARQRPLLDYILFTQRIEATHVYYEAVGYKIPIDAPPVYYRNLTLTGVVSELARTKLSELGFDTSQSYLYPNSAGSEYFEYVRQPTASLRNAAIVSNHTPSEIDRLPSQLARLGISADIFGMHHTYTPITPELLARYDLIVTIGKTAFNALALGIPVFLYDENVAWGYVTAANIDYTFKCNFAPKDFPTPPLDPNNLPTAIIDGYETAAASSPALKKYAKTHFHRDALLEQFLEHIAELPPIDYDELHRRWPTLGFTARTYVEETSFNKADIRRWYEKSLELGDLYQNEMSKYLALVKEHQRLLEEYNRLENEFSTVLNSKGWKLLEHARRVLRRSKS